MVIRSKENNIGAWAFLVGVVLAVLIGLATSAFLPIPTLTRYSSAIYAILVIIGLTIGFLNIKGKDSQTFMIAGAVLVIVSKFGLDSLSGTLIGIKVGATVSAVFSALLILFVPATIIVALKAVFEIAKV